MFGSIKKVLAVVAVAGVAAAAPAVASADEWAVPFPTATQISTSGTLEIYVPSTGTTTRCTNVTTGTGDLILNNGSPTSGAWGAMALLQSLDLNACQVVGIPACIVSFTPDFSSGAWTVDGDAASQRVRISGVAFQYMYSGAGCPLHGFTALVSGSVTGDYDSAGTLSFVSEPGLTATNPPFGPAYLSGSVFIDAAPALVIS